MKRIIYSIAFLFIASTLSLYAASEAEYGKLSKSYTLNEDGSQEFRYEMELTLFTHTAMNRTYGESFIVYNPKFQELKIHTSYTKQKDGTIIKTPENAFVEVLPRQAADAPAYNHLKEMVVVHTGLELGATIYLEYSIISKPGYLAELDICDAIEQTSPVKNYTITVSVPEIKPFFYSLVNSDAKPTAKKENGKQQVSWNIRNLPAASMAPQVTAMGGDKIMLLVSTYPSVNDALKVFNKQLVPSNNMPLLSLSETITEGKSSETEKLQAILTHVTDHIANSRLTLQETGFRIRSTDDVIKTAYGTEAEKVNLLAGLLNAAGIKAEVTASFLKNADINSCGLSAINDLFVTAYADGKQYLLSSKQKTMADGGWYGDYLTSLSVTTPGQAVNIQSPDATIEYDYAISLTPGQAEITTKGTTGSAFIPYVGNSPAKEKTTLPLKNNNGYLILSLPDSPISLSHAAYSRCNSNRKVNLLLSNKANESYRYLIELAGNIELASPEKNKTIDNAIGKASLSIKQNGNIVEVNRSLELKKQLITPADYTSFRTLMTEWADKNNRQLLIKVK